MAPNEVQKAAPTLRLAGEKALGAFYTPDVAADLMANWVIRDGNERILEPSFGDGVFVEALHRCAHSRASLSPEIIGVEVAEDTFEGAVASGLVDRRTGIRDDFLNVSIKPVDAAIGNPPYVRLRNLPPDSRERALKVSHDALDGPMDPSGSTWMPFTLHAARWIKPHGRMALVLPFEFTYVRYARPLWKFLGQNFGELRVVRARERMFPDILQETVLLFADRKGESTSEVLFEAYESVADMVGREPDTSARISLDEILAGERPFLAGLLTDALRELISRLKAKTSPSSELVTWRIGYVAGDKKYFHPDPQDVGAYELPSTSLVDSFVSGRQLGSKGIRTRTIRNSDMSQLFLPPADESKFTEGEKKYIRFGEETSVHLRYKCKIRNPWYIVPGLKAPDVLLPVFSETPQLIGNDDGALATNSFMCGYLGSRTSDELIASWYTSLTLLEAELKVHSLGGGVFVFVPSELGSMCLPDRELTSGAVNFQVRQLEKSKDRTDAFRLGDGPILGDSLGLDPNEIQMIQEGRETLRSWRLASSATE